MSANRFVMRRDTQTHTPPRPGVHPHPVVPPSHRPPRRAAGEAPGFWKEEERRRGGAEKAAPGTPPHTSRKGSTSDARAAGVRHETARTT